MDEAEPEVVANVIAAGNATTCMKSATPARFGRIRPARTRYIATASGISAPCCRSRKASPATNEPTIVKRGREAIRAQPAQIERGRDRQQRHEMRVAHERVAEREEDRVEEVERRAEGAPPAVDADLPTAPVAGQPARSPEMTTVESRIAPKVGPRIAAKSPPQRTCQTSVTTERSRIRTRPSLTRISYRARVDPVVAERDRGHHRDDQQRQEVERQDAEQRPARAQRQRPPPPQRRAPASPPTTERAGLATICREDPTSLSPLSRDGNATQPVTWVAGG